MSEGYAVFEPDTYARPGHSCAASSVAKRSEEVAYALNEIRRLPWVDHDRVVLMGFSEGGSTVAFWDQPGFMAHVILGAPARSRAPANVPVLAIAGADDTYADANTYRQKKPQRPSPMESMVPGQRLGVR
jgi:dienelactone hydrolase